MKTSDQKVIIALLDEAATAWAAGNESRAVTWCQRAWAHADVIDFVDTDEQTSR